MAGFARRAVLSGATPFLARAGITAAIALALFAVAGVSPSTAQGFGWFGNLFGGQQRPAAPRYPSYGQAPDSYYDRQPRRAPRRHPTDSARSPRDKDVGRDAAARDTTKDRDHAPPNSASAFVYVFGDSLGQSLASGLDESLADRPDVAVVHKAKGSTGLATADFYDWPKVIEDLVATKGTAARPEPENAQAKLEQAKPEQVRPGRDMANAGQQDFSKSAPSKSEAGRNEQPRSDPGRIDVAVMMIGSNDRQALRESGKVLERGTPEWTAAYRKRVLAIDEAFLRKGIPLVWVGVPITRDDDFADDMAAFNDIYREAAAKTGAVYVDSWEAFSDDDGDFNTVGPDINGQIVKLRTADGVYFTKAGGRKLAHFVEAHVRRALDGRTLARPLLPPPTSQSTPGVSKPDVDKPDIGPVSSLNDPPTARDGRLASAIGPKTEPPRDALVETVIVKGQGQAAPVGRADDLRWQPGNSGP